MHTPSTHMRARHSLSCPPPGQPAHSTGLRLTPVTCHALTGGVVMVEPPVKALFHTLPVVMWPVGDSAREGSGV